MKYSLVLISLYSFSSMAKCDYYTNVPKHVTAKIGDLKGISTADIETKIQSTFKKVIGEFAVVKKVRVNFDNFDGKYLKYKVSQTDHIWGAKGGSKYKVSVNTSTGKSNVKFVNCWDQ